MRYVQSKRTPRVTAARPAVFGVLAMVVAVLGAALTATGNSAEQTRPRRTRDDSNPLVRRGEFPPDFELPRLTFTTDSNGESLGVINQSDTVTLSSFRGKRPVCLIMSSYT